MSVRAEASVLQRLPLFAECDRTHLQVLAFSAGRAEFANGEDIVREGERGNAAFLLLNGRAIASVTEGAGRRETAELEPGMLVGELAMIGGLPYSLTATAVSRVVAASISRELFMRVAEEFPEFGARVHAALARKLDQSLAELKAVKDRFDDALPFSRR